MFNPLFYWSGVIFWVAAAIPIIWIVSIASADAYQCAVFTIRRVRQLPNGGFKPELPLVRTAFRYWFHLWWGEYKRPPYVYHSDTETIVWWPGKEDSVDV